MAVMTQRDRQFRQIIDNFQGMHRAITPRSTSLDRQLPLGQRAVLMTIALHGELKVTQLSEILHITPGAATQHITALSDAELVERIADPADRRGVIVRLSEQGAKYMQQLEQESLAFMKELFSDVSDQDMQAFVNILTKISHKLRNKGVR